MFLIYLRSASGTSGKPTGIIIQRLHTTVVKRNWSGLCKPRLAVIIIILNGWEAQAQAQAPAWFHCRGCGGTLPLHCRGCGGDAPFLCHYTRHCLRPVRSYATILGTVCDLCVSFGHTGETLTLSHSILIISLQNIRFRPFPTLSKSPDPRGSVGSGLH